MALAATTTITKTVTLKPTLRRKLVTELKAYAELKVQLAALEHALKKHKTAIEECVFESGETSLTVDGFKATMVAPVTSRLDKQRLVALGVTTAMIEEATITTPGRPYLKVTIPGTREDE